MAVVIQRYYCPSLWLLVSLLLTVLCYWPGLQGGFIFDDIPNLRDLSAYGGVTDWETMKSFVWGGVSSPMGRPLSLMSFLLDDNAWPSQASWFKPTNLAIHLLCGLLLAWATLLLLRVYGVAEETAQWMSVFAASCWLLHPFLVSTTLYVVQRMAQLATLFVFAGIAGYLYGRQLLTVRPRVGYLWMGGSIAVGTLLSVLSKENGALLPLLIGVVEFCAPTSDRLVRPVRAFRVFFTWLPSLAVLGYLVYSIDLSPNPWPGRNFNQTQRLLSESRVLWDYLGNLLLPRIEGQGLYRDDFVISQGLFSPVTTFVSLLSLLLLITVAFTVRRRWPMFSLAVLFFIAGQLLESTVIGLELYFEHRNYLPAAFLFLPIASGLNTLGHHVSKGIPIAIAFLIIAMLAFFTWNRARLWADTEQLELYWATTAVNSPRAQNAVAAYYMRKGLLDDARQRLEESASRMPNSPLLTMSLLLQKVWSQQATGADFTFAAKRLELQPFDAQAVIALRSLVDKVTSPEYPRAYRSATLKLLEQLSQNANYKELALFTRLIPFLKGQIYLVEKQPTEASRQLSEAMSRYNDADSALQMVAMTANSGYSVEALRLLDQAEALYHRQPDRTLKHSRAIFDREFARIRKTLNDDLQPR